MSGPAVDDAPTFADTHPRALERALAERGVWIDLGAATLRLQSNSAVMARQLRATYAHHPLCPRGDWADVHVQLRHATGLRRWIRPQVILWSDGQQAFEPFAATDPLPLFEWGCNWLLGRRMNDLLLLHAGAVERDGLAMLLPVLPGSGKSTLTAALSLRGWRLMSDEFGAYDPHDGMLRALLKPVALKNQSIDVIRRFSGQALIGPEFPNTRKGRVAHLAALPDAVARRRDRARPAAVVLPKWEAGSPTRLEALPEHVLFPALAFNAFNYSVLGEVGFRSVVRLVRQCVAWQLVYSDLDDALATLEAQWPRVVERSAGPLP